MTRGKPKGSAPRETTSERVEQAQTKPSSRTMATVSGEPEPNGKAKLVTGGFNIASNVCLLW